MIIYSAFEAPYGEEVGSAFADGPPDESNKPPLNL
jgi:hypothetical protein